MSVDTNQYPKVDSTVDPLWRAIRDEVAQASVEEPGLAGFLHSSILNHESLESALSYIIAYKLENASIPALLIRDLFLEAHAADASIGCALRADIRATVDRDPAASRYSEPLLYFKGFHALQVHRSAHWLWHQGRTHLALFVQSRVSEAFGVDIHPAARIGKGIMIDHATGVVVGETAVVEDCVSLLHEVTLGGTGKDSGDRHPKVRRGVLIGAGAKVLGNVEIGEGAKIGAGSVVLSDVPAHHTVAGVPAVVIGTPIEAEPALNMDQTLRCAEQSI